MNLKTVQSQAVILCLVTPTGPEDWEKKKAQLPKLMMVLTLDRVKFTGLHVLLVCISHQHTKKYIDVTKTFLFQSI